MVKVRKLVNTLLSIPKLEYDTIIWDISNQKESITIGGKEYCNHFDLDDNGRCQCGAYKGFIKDMLFSDYVQKILTELAISPANNNTIIISDRSIGKEALIKNLNIEQPKYKEVVWLSKAGTLWDNTKQKERYLIFTSKNDNVLSHSRFVVNPRFVDYRLLNLGKTLVINPRYNWIIDSSSVHYYTDDNI